MNDRTRDLLDTLTATWACWEEREGEYLTEVLPRIVRGDPRARITDAEKDVVALLRAALTPEEWERLPELIRQRRAENASARKAELADLEAARAKEKARQLAALRALKARADGKRDRESRREQLRERLQEAFGSDFLRCDTILKADEDARLISPEEFQRLKVSFVQEWAAQELGIPLDPQQASAVAATSGDIEVVARAGSGKTRTLIARAIFLQRHCRIAPTELLLLAFNKRAAEEMTERIGKSVGGARPHIMTFHALAYALIHPEEGLLVDDAGAEQFGLSRVVQDVIDEHVRSSECGVVIQELMLTHFREDWERIADGRFEATMDDFLMFRRALPRETLRGEYVKSLGEKTIANILFEHGVEYRYERNFRWNGVNYKPDFTIQAADKGGVIIEYFGLEGDPDYDRMALEKRAFWAEWPEWRLLEFSPRDILKEGVDGFVQLLVKALREDGWACERRSEEEIWELIRGRALDGFTAAMRTFVGRCRKNNWSVDDLRSRLDQHRAVSRAEELFLRVGGSIYEGYLSRLREGGKDDLDGLMWRAISGVRGGQTHFSRDWSREHGDISSIRHVLIDEFQDFSPMFFALTEAMRARNPEMQFFCVGDDWQAINAFAGSDLRYFKDFSGHFSNTDRYYLQTNYRSSRIIVDLGNSVMKGLGVEGRAAAQALPGSIEVGWLDRFKPTPIEQERHRGDEMTPALLRVLRDLLNRGLDVVMLSRRNGVPWYVDYFEGGARGRDALDRFLVHVRSFLPSEDRGRVTISTVHRFKGLEKGAVIVLDAVDRSFPLIHPRWIFLRIFGDSIEGLEREERRLFYVAVTRAKDSLTLLTEAAAVSPYLSGAMQRVRLGGVNWESLPPVASPGGPRLEIRVYDAFDVKEVLKALRYRFERTGKCWTKVVPAEGFSVDTLAEQPWACGRRVEICTEAGEVLHTIGSQQARPEPT